jgi:hypothetical protein
MNVGILCFVPYIIDLGIDKIITNSLFPETKTIPKISTILSFIALKLSNVKRYTSDDLWCMDRGSGFFAGLNVLAKISMVLFTFSSHNEKDEHVFFERPISTMAKSWVFIGHGKFRFCGGSLLGRRTSLRK